MMTDERLSEIEKIKWCGEHGFIPVELTDEIKYLRREVRKMDAEIEDVRGNNINLQDEIKRLRAELAKYKTPNVDNITIKGEVK